jgi:hypothetical protein
MAPQIPTPVILTRDVPPPEIDKNVALYDAIRNSSENLSFNTYSAFLTAVFCRNPEIWKGEEKFKRRGFEAILKWSAEFKTTSFECLTGSRAYESLRRATEIFVTMLAAMPESCRCVPKREHDTKGRALKKAKEIVDAEEADKRDDADDINRRYYPYSLTPSQVQRLIEQLLEDDEDLPRPHDGDTFERVLPMMRRLRENLRGVPEKDSAGDDCSGVLRWRLECPPFLELIWSYWMEQAMLVQGINAISLRFQNQRRGVADPLSRMDITWLRPLNGLLWGYIQNEQDRLTIVRRAYEYDHHYGLRLQGRSVPVLNAADSRSRFLEAFHALLAEATRFYRLSMDTTVRPDTFPVLNALKELHLILSEGAANQFGDLPATARQEMLIQQWLIGRPEMRDFLGGRPGVVYPEMWMGHMDTMRQIFGWNDASIRHYYDLAVYGERLLLSVRWTDWSNVSDNTFATSWLTFWRPEIQTYVHAYRAVAGLDLNTDQVRVQQPQLFAAQPTELILQRRAAAALPSRVR